MGTELATVRAALRSTAVLVSTDGLGGSTATGPFGEVAVVPRESRAHRPDGGDGLIADLCAALIRRRPPGESPDAMWNRALRRGRDLR